MLSPIATYLVPCRSGGGPACTPSTWPRGRGQDGPGGLELRSREVRPGQKRSELPASGRRAMLERVQGRQGLFPVTQVAPRGLAGAVGRCPDAQQVVDHLVGKSEVVAEAARPLGGFLAGAGCDGSELGGATEKGTGLQTDHLCVLVDRDLNPLLELG